MTPQWPVIDVLIVRDGRAWRIYFAPWSWDPPMLRRCMNAQREVCSVGRPDLDDLEQFMWATDAPYEKRPTGDGGVALFANGRGGFMLAFWLAGYVEPHGWWSNRAGTTVRSRVGIRVLPGCTA
jgi:hypothetical protein